MELLQAAPSAPPYWVSQLAEDCAAFMEVHDHRSMQNRILRECEGRHLAPMTVARMVGEEWDRLGIVRVGIHFPGMR